MASCGTADQHDAVKVGNAFIKAGFIDVDPVTMSKYAAEEALEEVYRDFENDSPEQMAAMRQRSVELNVGYVYDGAVSSIGDSTALLSYDITVGPQSQTIYAVELELEMTEGRWRVIRTFTKDPGYDDRNEE